MCSVKKILESYYQQVISLSPPGKNPKIGERQAATLLHRAIVDGTLESGREGIVQKLNSKDKKIAYNSYLKWRKKKSKMLDNHLEMSNFLVYRYQDTFSRLIIEDGWNLVGDIENPILLIKKDSYSDLFPGEEEKIFEIVPRTIKYNSIHYLSISEKGKIHTSGGNSETINFYYHSYPLHEKNCFPQMIQKKDLIKICPVKKLISFLKGLSMFSDRSLDYKIRNIDFIFEDPNLDLFSLSREIARLYFCIHDQKYHLKNKYFNNDKVLKKFFNLDRIFKMKPPWKKNIDFNKIKNFLKVLLIKMIEILIPKLEPVTELSNLDTSLFSLSPILIKEWEKSPKDPSNRFIKEWLSSCDTNKLASYFETPNRGVEKLKIFPGVIEKIIKIPQKGNEWLQIYSGEDNNTMKKVSKKNDPESLLVARYNLIRGNISETWVLDYLSKIHPDLIQIGIIGDDLSDSKKFFSPDGLLLKDNKIELIEVKSILGEPGLSPSFLRDYHLAKLQLSGTAKVINNINSEKIVEKGIGYFLFIFPDEQKNWIYQLHKVDYNL